MIVVVDTNILVSALIKDSVTRKIITELDENYVTPEIVFEELLKHEKLILRKSGLDKNEYRQVLKKLLEHVNVIPHRQSIKHLNEAKKIMEKIDPSDVLFISTALCFRNAAILSDDKDFEKQDRIKVIKTSELAKRILKNG